MCMVQSTLDIVDGSIWHSTALQDIQPFLRGLVLDRLLDHAINVRTMLDAIAIRHEASIRLPFRVAQAIAKHAKQAVIATAK